MEKSEELAPPKVGAVQLVAEDEPELDKVKV
jgi:hypothetical protein